MRALSVTLAVVLAACGGDDDSASCMYQDRTYQLGDSFPAGDGCNACSCTASGIACTALACVPGDGGGIDAPAGYCGATGGCPSGPACGTICCDQGERCDNGVCRCGTGAACGAGNTCEAAGPVGELGCGSVCCGASGPCPQ